MREPMKTEVAAAWIALGGTVLALIWNIVDRTRSAFDDRMSQATELLTGQTQRRSAGIAIIEGSQRRLTGSQRPVIRCFIRGNRAWLVGLTGLLCAQAVYLLKSSGQGKRPDEIFNLNRIMTLLIMFRNHLSGQLGYQEVIKALRDGESPAKKAGAHAPGEKGPAWRIRTRSKHKESSKPGRGLDRSAIKAMFGDKIFEDWIKGLSRPGKRFG
jgi:hypothetical protein